MSEADYLVASASNDVFRIGRANQGEGVFLVRDSGQTIAAPRLESERFASDSWFHEGIDGYVRRLLDLPIR